MVRGFVIAELTLCIAIILVTLLSAERMVSLFVNPGCGDLCTVSDVRTKGTVNLIYVKAKGDNDTIHYIWSTIGSFGILMATTDPSSQLAIDWDRILSSNLSSSITFNPPSHYSSAVILTRLWTYEDVDDTADIKSAWLNLTTGIPFGNFSWDVDARNVSETRAQAEFVLSTNLGNLYGNKTLKLIMNAFGNSAHYNVLPMLPHTPSSLQVELVLDGFISPYNRTRFALEMALVSSELSDDYYDIEKLKSIDDEYTPGVFTTVQVTAPRRKHSNIGSFLLWKPICYTTPDRTTEDSTDTHERIGNLSIRDRALEMEGSLANAFYGPDFLNILVNFVNVSYGLEEDGFYTETNFLSWTAVVGLGSPPVETFSTLVIIVITVGFGIPTVLIIIGGLFVILKRLRSRGDELQLNNDNHSKIIM